MNNRVLSVDVLRGMTIFFMIVVNTPGTWEYVYAPLRHAPWHGCTPTDLVFPFFLFIVGVSMSISLKKYFLIDHSGSSARSQMIKKILKRTALIFAVGLLLNWFPFFHKNIADLRVMGVLQRIALAYGGAALLVVLLRDKVKLGYAAVFLLLGYWALMYFGGGVDPYTIEGNLSTKIDPSIFGLTHVYGGFGVPFDPEGLLGMIPSVAHVLIGYFMGLLIQEKQQEKPVLVGQLLKYGIGLSIIGWIWSYGFPLNKPLWTSSYVLYTCGLATVFLAILMWIIDIQGWTKWAYIFRVFGLNPLASYVLSGVLVRILLFILKWDGGNGYSWLYAHIFQPVFGNFSGSLAFALTVVMVVWVFAWGLYRRGIVVKL